MTGRPITGLRVVDLTSLGEGPSAGSVLAGLGADVLRVEPPGGDPGRARDGWGDAARGCRSLTLALDDPRGANILLRLVVDCDVLVERFAAGTLEAWGLGETELLDARPGLVLVRGHGDPAAQATEALAAAGCGPADGPPAKPGPAPTPGWHTEVVFGELGLTRGELDDLRADGVV